jgi:hypothetical protein
MMNFRIIGLCIAAIAGLTACGGGGSSATPAGATSIVGTWGNGTETQTYRSNNTFASSVGGCTYSGGTYAVAGNKVTVATVPTTATPSGTTPAACGSVPAGFSGYSFTYTISGNTLTYTDSTGATPLYSLAGKWSNSGAAGTESYTFNADGSYVLFASLTGAGSCTFTGGTYTMSGEKLTFTAPTAGAMTGTGVNCAISVVAGLGGLVSTVTINSVNQMTSTIAGVPTVYTRG